MKNIDQFNFRLYLNRTHLHLYNTSFFKIKRSVIANKCHDYCCVCVWGGFFVRF